MKKITLMGLVGFLVFIVWFLIPRTSISNESEEQPERFYREVLAEVTAYTSSVEETDDTPLITASGSVVDRSTAACPGFLPFGTKIEINGNIYECKDRMNKRYRDDHYYDIWVESKGEAYEWGRQQLIIKIFE